VDKTHEENAKKAIDKYDKKNGSKQRKGQFVPESPGYKSKSGD